MFSGNSNTEILNKRVGLRVIGKRGRVIAIVTLSYFSRSVVVYVLCGRNEPYWIWYWYWIGYELDMRHTL